LWWTRTAKFDPKIVRSEDPDAAKSALETLKKWRFKPAMCGKEPMEARVNLEMRITLR
jgi:outer membrane biosynthesis protein TonB